MVSLSLQDIAKALGGQVTGDRVRAPGPGHSSRDRSLWVRLAPDHPDGFIAGSMSPRDADWRTCKEYVRSKIGLPRWSPDGATPVRRSDVDLKRRKILHDASPKALELWRASRPAQGEVEAYLRKERGFLGEIPVTLRQGSTLELGRIPIPTMVAAVASPDRRVIAVQETKLTWGGRKSTSRMPRITHGSLGAGAVRLFPVGAVLGLAEGVEDALGAFQLFGTPCWATLGAQRLSRIAIPPEVRQVIIFADNDEAGREAASAAADQYRREALEVEVRLPPDEFFDWSDVARANFREARA